MYSENLPRLRFATKFKCNVIEIIYRIAKFIFFSGSLCVIALDESAERNGTTIEQSRSTSCPHISDAIIS